ncbi:MAG: hypothetical protein M3O61_09260 [Gemmatimonadota bacterium]|nr:hypothetical protein [Gemmatimonadota bacterium]
MAYGADEAELRPISTKATPRSLSESHSSAREGIIAGFLGATAIAVWFLIVDIVSGRALYTPDLLGRGLISILGKPPVMPDTVLTHVIAYTLFHYAAFALVGVIVAYVVHKSAETPAILAGFLILFVVIQIGAYGLAGLFTESEFGNLAWYQIFIANLIATVVMGWFMWTRHPGLKHDIDVALTGTDA